MVRRLPVLIGVVVALLLGTGVAAAVVRSGDETSTASPERATTTTAGPVVASVPSSNAPTTTLARPTTTRAAPAITTATTARPPATAAPAPATTATSRPVLTRAAANQGLCREIGTAVQSVASGSAIAGGFRLVRALNTYGDAADPAVVAPARRMVSAGLSGDYDAGATATDEAGAACQRLGFGFALPRGPECLVDPCP